MISPDISHAAAVVRRVEEQLLALSWHSQSRIRLLLVLGTLQQHKPLKLGACLTSL